MIKSTLKIARYCPLVIQGFSNFLGLFQGIMANPEDQFKWGCFNKGTWPGWLNGLNFLGLRIFSRENKPFKLLFFQGALAE